MSPHFNRRRRHTNAIKYMFSKIKSIFKKINGPMPLVDFQDYNEYWKKRQHENAAVLHRYIVIKNKVPDGSSVLDIGCGNGGFLKYLKKERPNCDVVGIDVSSEAVENLKTEGFAAYLAQCETSARELTGRDFDYVVLMEVVEHAHDAEQLVRQALECNPRSIFITIPNVGYFMHRLRLMFGGRFPVTTILFHMKEHIRFWTVKDFKQWMEYLGCRVVSCVGQQQTRNKVILFLMRISPGWFASQVVYEVVRSEPR